MTITRFVVATIATLATAGLLGAGYDWNILWQGEVATNLLWNERQAYLFVGTRTSGWQGHSVSWLRQVVRNYFFASTQVQSTVFSTTVFKIRADAVERMDLSGAKANRLLVANSSIYGSSPDGMFLWTGDTFAKLSRGDAETIRATSPPAPPYDSVDGWSHRSGLLNGGEGIIHIVLDGRPLTLETASQGFLRRITISRQDRPTETLLEIDGRPQYVDRDTYASALNR